MCHILTAKFEDEILASWMLFIYQEVLYYPYGGSSTKHRNLFASNALGWESIRFGKEKGCKLFDMWGAAEDPDDRSDSYYGFTNFKAKFNGEHVIYIDSYDLPIKPLKHFVFTRLNNIRWRLLELGLIK
jgi:lipid II:glycine glycyltransferase (peptidoglycan interpeptide bridge formation enzyme)